MIGRLPLDDQLDSLRAVLSRNSVLTEVLERTATMALPGWCLTADAGDLSGEAEDAVIKAGREIFADLPAEVEVRNEARVHLWYEDRFGVPCPPYDSTEAAIDSFAATTCCLGVRPAAGGGSTHRTVSPTSSTSSCCPTPYSHHGPYTKPSRRAG
ncbi:hypothetical protein EDD92_6164 [Streptomyces sp. TLI_185]|nr:hypothetical protein EDD92_6164 [Streptomyces sp. TLI_185]